MIRFSYHMEKMNKHAFDQNLGLSLVRLINALLTKEKALNHECVKSQWLY